MAEGGPSEDPRDAPKREALTHAERIFVRISVLQTVLAVAGMFTGAVALYAALHESAAVRRQSAAAVWPYVQLSVNDHVSEDTARFAVVMTNAGVGPAKLQALRVTVDGAPMTGWRDAMAVIVERDVDYGHDFASGRVLRAGETIRLISIENDREAVTLSQAAVFSGRAQLAFCYCSIFDQCWMYDPAKPEPRAELPGLCPDYGADAFAD